MLEVPLHCCNMRGCIAIFILHTHKLLVFDGETIEVDAVIVGSIGAFFAIVWYGVDVFLLDRLVAILRKQLSHFVHFR